MSSVDGGRDHRANATISMMSLSALSFASSGRTRASSIAISSLAAVATAGALFVWLRYRNRKSKTWRLHRLLQCQCGSVKIQVDAATPTHLICYCDDCQNYEQYCWNGGGSRRISDRNGGLRICQVYKSDLIVLEGRNRLQATVLDPAKRKDQGMPFQVFRFHAECCQSPMISACLREFPVVGFFVANLVDVKDAGEGAPGDENVSQQPCLSDYISDDPEKFDWNDEQLSGLPPVQYRIQTQYAKGKKLPEGALAFPNRLVLSVMWRSFVVGLGKNNTSPFPFPAAGQEIYRNM
jgi:Family of unknown function (DUF6151)